MRQILSLLLSLSTVFVFSQCPYPTANTLVSTQTFCVDNPTQSINVTTNTTRFVKVNVVQGFKYTFSIGNVYTSLNENINVYNDATNAPIINSSGASGTSISNWTATYSGVIKIVISQGACVQTNTTNVTLVIQVTDIGNTFDNQNDTDLDKWVGHVYNWVGTSPPPGGASPTSPNNSFPFTSSNYVGYYPVGTETLTENFGGNDVCFPVYSNGVVRTNIRTEVFAVRYKMTSTRPAGCYIITLRGDDGIRLYNDGVLVFNEWKQQGPTNYSNVLVYLDGNADLIYDFYEYNGQNVADLSIQPFDSSSNSVAAPTNSIVCNNVAPGTLDGSTFTYNGGVINPTITFQWQVSTDNITFTNISGATSENYSPPAINTGGVTTIRYYRRTVSATSAVASCNSPSNSVSITTTGTNSTTPTSTSGTLQGCSSFTANWNATTNATNYLLDVSTVSNFASFVPGYHALNVGNVTSYNLTGLSHSTTYYFRIRAVYSCGTSGYSTVRNISTTTFGTPNAQAATNVSCGGFRANWNLATNATSYEIDIATTSTFTAGTYLTGYQALNVGNVTFLNISNMNVSTLYYRVRSVGTCGVSTDSSVITVNLTVSSWDGTSWSNGTPSISTSVFINGNYNTSTNGNLDACSVVVNSGSDVIITSNAYFNIQNNLTVNGSLTVLNNGSLIQVNDLAVNTGNITYQRSTTGVALDYVYWSSPVSGVNTPAGNIFKWSPTFANPNGGQGYWIRATNMLMQSGVGYIMRDVFARNFNGIPNNGLITTSIARGSDLGAGSAGPNGVMRTTDDDNWNLLGNPYPSSIDVGTFLSANTNIDGFVNVWTHGTPLSAANANHFYGSYTYNYSASDYMTINSSGNSIGPSIASVIGAGQGFFVLMKSGAAATSSVVFNNTMRNKGYSNNQFYRVSDNDIEKNRIWLDLVSPSMETTRTLVAYVDEATDNRDDRFDAITTISTGQNFYSILGSDIFVIQGKSLPFLSTDEVPLGLKVNSIGLYSIAISAVDGLFSSNQEIFVEDKELNVIHNLKEAPYSFSINTVGTSNNRFVLRYTDSRLSNDNFQNSTNEVKVITTNALQIISSEINIGSIEFYDLLGKLLVSKKNISQREFSIENFQKTNSALFVKIVLESGKQVNKKIFF